MSALGVESGVGALAGCAEVPTCEARRTSPPSGILRTILFSVLDLAPIRRGGDAAQAFRNSLDLAQHDAAWDFKRFWLAEHHNMTGIASAATSVVIEHVPGSTKSASSPKTAS